MNKLTRVSGGVLQMNSTKLYSPEFRNHMTPGFFVIRYPERSDSFDEMEEFEQETEGNVRHRTGRAV